MSDKISTPKVGQRYLCQPKNSGEPCEVYIMEYAQFNEKYISIRSNLWTGWMKFSNFIDHYTIIGELPKEEVR